MIGQSSSHAWIFNQSESSANKSKLKPNSKHKSSENHSSWYSETLVSSFHKDTQNCRQGDGEKANTQLKPWGGPSCGHCGRCRRMGCRCLVHSWKDNLEGFLGVTPVSVLAKHGRFVCILTVVVGPYQVYSGGNLLVEKWNDFSSTKFIQGGANRTNTFSVKNSSLFDAFCGSRTETSQKMDCLLLLWTRCAIGS